MYFSLNVLLSDQNVVKNHKLFAMKLNFFFHFKTWDAAARPAQPHLDGSDDLPAVVDSGGRHQGNQQVLKVAVRVALQVVLQSLREETVGKHAPHSRTELISVSERSWSPFFLEKKIKNVFLPVL